MVSWLTVQLKLFIHFLDSYCQVTRQNPKIFPQNLATYHVLSHSVCYFCISPCTGQMTDSLRSNGQKRCVWNCSILCCVELDHPNMIHVRLPILRTWGKTAWVWFFTTYPYLVPRLESRAVPLLSLWAFMTNSS